MTQFAKLNLTFAKIVATPTFSSWAQVYNAGSVFALCSLKKRNGEETQLEQEPLSMLGKDLLNTFEEEYFTLEEKTFETIKQAAQTACQKFPEGIEASLLIASLQPTHDPIHPTIVYVFMQGAGKIQLVRNNKITPLLQNEQTVTGASGYLQDNDTLVLQTDSFENVITRDILLASLANTPLQEAADALAPKIHQQDAGDVALMLIQYTQPAAEEKETTIRMPTVPESPLPPPISDNLRLPETSPAEPRQPMLPLVKIRHLLGTLLALLPQKNVHSLLRRAKTLLKIPKLNHKKKLFLTVALLLVLMFFVSIYLTLQKRDHDKKIAAFHAVYDDAQKKYDEGQSLIGLNKNLARETLLQSKTKIDSLNVTLDKDSPEDKQLKTLRKNIETALAAVSGVNMVSSQQVTAEKSKLLAPFLKNSDVRFTTADEKGISVITDKEILQDDKTLVENDNDWNDIAGFGTFLGNFYVLDKQAKNVLKFVPAGSGYGKTNYFTANAVPDLSKAVSLTIDGSIYLLYADGTISKFTRGKADSFTVSGLDSPLVNPKALVTPEGSDLLYVLDSGNKRVVVIKKDGTYESQYTADILGTATAIDVQEKDKKLFVLSNKNIWEISLP